jgi:CrcB protein
MKDIMLVAVGGLFGAVCRFLIGRWSARHFSGSFPAATLMINFAGSFLIGFFLVWTTDRVMADPRWRLLIAIGFCGAFTTFSSYAFETFALFEKGAFGMAAWNLVSNNVAALAAVVLGAVIARIL